MSEPADERRTDTGVEFEEFLDLPILDPEEVERSQAQPDEGEDDA